MSRLIMASERMANDEVESRYKPLAVPEFKCTIPPHLLSKLPEADRYLVEIASKMEQQAAWTAGVLRDTNEATVAIDARLGKVEKWKERLMSRWTMVVALAVICIPVVLKAVVDRWFGKP